MFKKSIPIIFVGLSVVVAILVLSWAVFVKSRVVTPVQAPTMDSNKIISDDNVSNDVDDNIDDNNISKINTSDWKTYRNEEYGFEFRYLSTLYFFDCSKKFYEPDPLYIYFTPYANDNCNTPGKARASVISISTVKNFNKNNIINLLDNNIKEEKIIIGNKSAIQISGNREVVGGEGEELSSVPVRAMIYTIIPFENNTSVEILYSRIAIVNNNANGFYIGEDLSNIYDQLLSTFKFINS